MVREVSVILATTAALISRPGDDEGANTVRNCIDGTLQLDILAVPHLSLWLDSIEVRVLRRESSNQPQMMTAFLSRKQVTEHEIE